MFCSARGIVANGKSFFQPQLTNWLISSVLQALAHAELATEQRSLSQSLAELDSARHSLQDELHMEMAAGLDTAAMLQVTSGLSTGVDQHLFSLSERLVLLGERMAWVCSEASKEKCARCRFEKLLWAKQQHIVDLELSLLDSNQAVGEAVTECLMLSSQVRQLWEEKVTLLEQVLSYVCRL
jgi:hypothetical protein